MGEIKRIYDMELHTFVICAYGKSRYLEECIHSLLRQTVKSKILIATSTPNDLIDKLGKQYHLDIRINREGKGIADDWNFAYAQAKSKYVTLAHQDDIYESDYTESMLELLENAEKPLIFFSNYGEIRHKNKIKSNALLRVKRIMLMPIRYKKMCKYRIIKRGIVSLGNPICCPAVTYVKENIRYPLFKKHFKSNLDWEVWERLSNEKGSFEYSGKILMYHRIHVESETSILINSKERTIEDYEMLSRFWPQWVVKICIKVYSKGENSNKI